MCASGGSTSVAGEQSSLNVGNSTKDPAAASSYKHMTQHLSLGALEGCRFLHSFLGSQSGCSDLDLAELIDFASETDKNLSADNQVSADALRSIRVFSLLSKYSNIMRRTPACLLWEETAGCLAGGREQHNSSSFSSASYSVVALQQLSVLEKEHMCDHVEWHCVVMGTPRNN